MSKKRKKTIGLLAPGGNTTIGNDFVRWIPDNVALKVEHIDSDPSNDSSTSAGLMAGLAHMNDNLEAPTLKLARDDVDIIAFGCTGASFMNGYGYEEVITRKISEIAGGIKTITTSKAVIDALRELSVSRIAVCTPYPDNLNKRLEKFYSDAGFEIVGFSYKENADGSEQAISLALDVNCEEAEAIFISCTDFRGACEIIRQIETITGKPVITSNQATFWSCISLLGITTSLSNGGRLLSQGVSIPTHSLSPHRLMCNTSRFI